MAIYFANSELTDPAGESWRITSNFNGDNNFVGYNGLTNWEKSDDVYGGGNLSTPILSYSNGVFTFQTYGWFLIHWMHYSYMTDNCRWSEMTLQVSWNNGSNYDDHGLSTGNTSPNTSANYSMGGNGTGFVLGNSNTRLRWNIQVENNSTTTFGNTDYMATGFSIVKIASENP